MFQNIMTRMVRGFQPVSYLCFISFENNLISVEVALQNECIERFEGYHQHWRDYKHRVTIGL